MGRQQGKKKETGSLTGGAGARRFPKSKRKRGANTNTGRKERKSESLKGLEKGNEPQQQSTSPQGVKLKLRVDGIQFFNGGREKGEEQQVRG